MRNTRKLVLFLIITALGSFTACSGPSPTIPITNDIDQVRNTAGHILLGIYNVRIDLTTCLATVAPERMGTDHFDVTQYLLPPVCSDCFIIQVINLDWDNLEVTAEVTVKNFTASLTGYDVRGIVYPLGEYVLKNPHAYTLLHAPPECEDVAGFRAFDTEDPDRILGPSESATETFVLGFPDGAGFIDLVFAIDASWPDHCPEPYDIHSFEQTSLDMAPDASAVVSVYVSDWQEDTGVVTIDTDILGGTNVDLDNVSGEIWSGTITNVLGIPPGTWPMLITAKDGPTVKQLFQWVEIEITDLSDHDPPVWDSDEGITEISFGLSGVLVEFGLASDPSEPVTYNLYWVEGNTLDFDTANKVSGLEKSPHLLTSLNPGLHTFCLRAEDVFGNETTNVDFENGLVGEHPNVWWVPGPNMTIPRGFAGAFVANGDFWVLGGSATGTMFDVVERYDTVNESWDSPWSLPEPRDGFGCGIIGEDVYIFGGRYSETNVTESCVSVDLITGNPGPSLPSLPQPLANMGCALLDGTFYITAGRSFTGSAWEEHRKTYSFAPPGPDFVNETDLDFDTFLNGFAAGEGFVISCGGALDRDDVVLYDPGTGIWESKVPLPFGRQGNASLIVDGWLYSIGGDSIWMALTNVDVLDIVNDTWHSISPLNTRRTASAAATDGTYIYVAGGIDFVGPAYIPLASFEIGRIY